MDQENLERRVHAQQEQENLEERTHAQELAEMNSEVWQGLPLPIMELVFARLPPPRIRGLACLSREWRTTMNTRNRENLPLHSDFFGLCAEANPRALLGFIVPHVDSLGRIEPRVYSLFILDIKSFRWHTFSKFTLTTDKELSCGSLVSDGGLVCDISMAQSLDVQYFRIVVMNLLTGSSQELPRHLGKRLVAVHMLQIKIVDVSKKHYEVLVGDTKDADGKLVQVAQIYASHLDDWTEAQGRPDVFCGEIINGGQGAFFCAEGRLIAIKPIPWSAQDKVVFFKNSMFVLQIMERRGKKSANFIVEYQLRGEVWARVGTHRCSFESPPTMWRKWGLVLKACKRYLIVFEYVWDMNMHERCFLYDLCTQKWSEVPSSPKRNHISKHHLSTLIELNWDMHPFGKMLYDQLIQLQNHDWELVDTSTVQLTFSNV